MCMHVQAKRAARDAARGFDVAAAVRQLDDWVAAQGDMLAFDPAGKHGMVSSGDKGQAMVGYQGSAEICIISQSGPLALMLQLVRASRDIRILQSVHL